MVENLSRRCGGFLKSLSLRGCQLVSDNAIRLTILNALFFSKIDNDSYIIWLAVNQ